MIFQIPLWRGRRANMNYCNLNIFPLWEYLRGLFRCKNTSLPVLEPPPPHKKNHATQRWCLSLNTLGKNMQCKDDIQETGLLLARRPLLPPFLRSHLNVQGSHITHSFHCFHVCAFPDTYTATTLSWCVERFHAVSAVIARVNCSKESLCSCTKTGLNTNWSSPSCFTLTSFTSECIL